MWCIASLLIGKQKVVDQLLSPFNDASDNVKGEHSEGVKDVYTFVQKLRVTLLCL